MTSDIVGGVVAGLILYWLLKKDKGAAKQQHKAAPRHSGRPAAFRDVVRPPCGC